MPPPPPRAPPRPPATGEATNPADEVEPPPPEVGNVIEVLTDEDGGDAPLLVTLCRYYPGDVDGDAGDDSDEALTTPAVLCMTYLSIGGQPTPYAFARRFSDDADSANTDYSWASVGAKGPLQLVPRTTHADEHVDLMMRILSGAVTVPIIEDVNVTNDKLAMPVDSTKHADLQLSGNLTRAKRIWLSAYLNHHFDRRALFTEADIPSLVRAARAAMMRGAAPA
mmetsp:Transcript_14574/g.37797  ORF Transcript_14574/g.37797 Transcript_14574/m.37797 type:complete len:224 (+) Transcript_14574:2-673(+)